MGRIAIVDPHQTFDDIDGNDIVKDEKGEPVTAAKVLKFAVANELKTDSEGTQAEVVDRRIKHHNFLSDIRDAIKNKTLLQFTEEECKYLEGRVAMSFNTLVAGPVIHLLRKLEHPKAVVAETKGGDQVEVRDSQK